VVPAVVATVARQCSCNGVTANNPAGCGDQAAERHDARYCCNNQNCQGFSAKRADPIGAPNVTITIGVPVFNGAAMLHDCLACIRDQTFRDFTVLIYDNASTDQTGDIARAFCVADPRFHYFRQQQNRGPGQNFIDVLEAARSPFFMWRAHDDLSDLNFLEVCHATLLSSSSAFLAVGRVERERIALDGKSTLRTIPFRLETGGTWLRRFRNNLAHMHQSWFYGLWRRPELRDVFHRIYGAYPHPWASDFLTLYGVLVKDGIVGSNDTAFRVRLVRKASQHSTQAEPRAYATLAERRQAFRAICETEVSQLIDRFASRCVASRTKLLKLRMRDRTTPGT
jgi:glycosyltransferase involved in cell wall biosynthesis